MLHQHKKRSVNSEKNMTQNDKDLKPKLLDLSRIDKNITLSENNINDINNIKTNENNNDDNNVNNLKNVNDANSNIINDIKNNVFMNKNIDINNTNNINTNNSNLFNDSIKLTDLDKNVTNNNQKTHNKILEKSLYPNFSQNGEKYIININQVIDKDSILVETNHTQKRFLFYDKNKNHLGSFSIYEFIKYITSHVSNNFLKGIDYEKVIPIVDKFICKVKIVDKTDNIYDIAMLSYLESPFMGNVETLIKLYSFINEFENNNLTSELIQLDNVEASNVTNIFNTMLYSLLNHILKIIASLTNKLTSNNDIEATKIKNSLLNYSIVIVFKLSKLVKNDMTNKIKQINSAYDELVNINKSKMEINSHMDLLQKSIDKQQIQLDIILRTFLIEKNINKNNDSNNDQPKISNTSNVGISSSASTSTSTSNSSTSSYDDINSTYSHYSINSSDKVNIYGDKHGFNVPMNDKDNDNDVVKNIMNAIYDKDKDKDKDKNKNRDKDVKEKNKTMIPDDMNNSIGLSDILNEVNMLKNKKRDVMINDTPTSLSEMFALSNDFQDSDHHNNLIESTNDEYNDLTYSNSISDDMYSNLSNMSNMSNMSNSMKPYINNLKK